MTHTFNAVEKGDESLIIYLHLHHNYKLIRRSTGVRCTKKEWDPVKKRLKGYDDSIRNRNELLDRWDFAAKKASYRALSDALSADDCIEMILVELGIDPNKKKSKKEVDPQKLLMPFYLHWATYSTSFKQCTRGDKYCYSKLCEYLGDKVNFFTFDDVNYQFYCSYTSYLQSCGLKPNSIGNHIKKLKAVMNSAFKKELHSNKAFHSFEKPSVDVFNVYLTDREISSLLSLELSDSQSIKVRDLFILSCRTGLRYSDVIRLNTDMIQNGRIHIWQQKTSDDIFIPVHPDVLDILNRYGGKAPEISQQKVNLMIKLLAKAAGITQKISYTTVEANNVKRTITKEKCELITSHTARRSFATNAYLAGIPTISIMKLTGHRSESSFMKYIKITKEQIADQLMENPFFKR